MNEVVLYLSGYVAILFGVSWYIARRQSGEDFLIAGRNRPWWQILLSKFAASIGAGYFITYTGFAYEYQAGVFLLLVGLIIGFLLFAYWAAPRIAKHAREGKFYTVGHLVSYRTNSSFAGMIANVLSSAILAGWLVVGVIGSGKLIADLGLLSYEAAVILTSVVVLGYLYLAGFRAVIITDVIQSVIIFILVALVAFNITGNNLGAIASSLSFGEIDIGIAVGFFLFGVFSVFSYAERYQLAYAAKNSRELKHGLGLSVIPIILVATFLLFIGTIVRMTTPGLDSGIVFVEALKMFLSPTLLPAALILFFAGIMSSADTNIYGIASHFALARGRRAPQLVKRAIVSVTFGAMLLALLFPNVVQVSILAGGISMLLSWPMIYIISGGGNLHRFLGSIVTSIAGFVLGLVIFGISPAAAILVIAGGWIGLLYKKKSPQTARV